MAGSNLELQSILRALLAEVQHLRADYALLEARLSGSPSVADLLEVKKAIQKQIVKEHEELVAKIEALP